MEYGRIIAITGLPGLFELISSKSDGGIVRSLEDKSTRFVSSRVHQFSHLESIEVYTTRYNVNLVEVLQAMSQSSEKLPDEKNAAAVKTYFETVYPDLDHSRVYSSDLKKMVKWFGVLKANEVELKLSEQPAEDAGQDEEEITEAEIVDAAPKKKKEKPEPAAAKTESKKAAGSDLSDEPKKASPAKKPEAKAEKAENKETKKAAPKKAAPKEEKTPAAKAAPKKTAGKK